MEDGGAQVPTEAQHEPRGEVHGYCLSDQLANAHGEHETSDPHDVRRVAADDAAIDDVRVERREVERREGLEELEQGDSASVRR
ncbi:hypothetical protein GCM10020369_12830 [Cryptosporangium minutisporangium]|uniref:DUF2382 domain-containing protein n=1 Tax=Cryptosporangium minutisporangium TaxID=113569 RepID=A0ABP6SSE6_9ACTN